MIRRLVVAMGMLASTPVAAQPLTVYSAGSAKGVLTAILAQYTRETGESATEVGGPAGAMRDRIEAGEPADIFVSANMGYARKFAAEGKGTPAIVFARSSLCAIALPAVGITATNVLARLLDPAVRIGTSNPANDPSGQYAFAVFDRAEKLHPGAAAILKAKDKLPDGKRTAAAQSNLAQMLTGRGIDATISFCAAGGPKGDASVTKVELPPELTVPVAYGLTVVTRAADPIRREAAFRLAAYLMSPEAQAILPEYGFKPVGMVVSDQQ